MSYNLFNNAGVNGPICKAGLAEASTDADIQISAPNGAGVDYFIDGIAYHKADTDEILPQEDSASCTEQSANTTALYIVQINAAGTVSVKQSNIETSGSGELLERPLPDSGNVVLGEFVVVAGAAAFQVGVDDFTDDLDGAGSITFYDFALGGPATAGRVA